MSNPSGDLGDAIYRALAGRSPDTEPTTFSAALGWFTRAAGGNVSAAARLAGVPRRTFRDWLDGKGLGPRSAARREQVRKSAQLSARRDRLKPGREARLRAKDPSNITLIGRYNYDPGTGNRQTVEIGRYLASNAYDRLIGLYLAGGSAAELREEFASLLVDDATGFYERTLKRAPTDDHGWTVQSVNL